MNLASQSEKTREIMNAILANTAKLNACPGPHDFSVDASPERRFCKKWGCSKCGGIVDALHKGWYERGLAHGRASTATSNPTTSQTEAP